MNYSLISLTTWAQCDAVLGYANTKLGLLNYQDNQTNHRTGNLTTSAGSQGSELNTLNAYITAMTPVIGTLPVGRDRDKQQDELRVKTDRRDTLMSRQAQTGPEVLVKSELDATLVDVQLAPVQDLIDQVTTHRATLRA